MNYICAYFDTQGFTINKSFHPAEAAMSSKTLLIQVAIAKTCDCEPSWDEKQSIRYLVKKHHGISTNAGGIKPKEFQNLCETFYLSCRSKEKFLVAVKSKEAQEYLKELNIPSINIEKEYGATYNKIKTGRVPCNFHGNKADYIRCSLNNVHDMRSFMINIEKEKK